MLFLWAIVCPSRTVLRRATPGVAVAGPAMDVGVGEREGPRAAEELATGGGMERRLSGLERFAGGGFREEAMAVNQVQRGVGRLAIKGRMRRRQKPRVPEVVDIKYRFLNTFKDPERGLVGWSAGSGQMKRGG